LFELRTVALGGSEKQPEVSRGLSVAASGRLSTATDQLPGSAARWSVYGEIVKMLDWLFQVFLNGFNFTEATLVKVWPLLNHTPHRNSNAPQRSLESFFGIGPKVSQGLMAKFHIHPWAKVGSLKNATVMDLTAELSNMKIENDLRREVQDNIRRLKDMGTYRGRRHAMGLPVRGQRTRTQVRMFLLWKLD
jgi:small subunit ribosomal protein S13